MIFGEDSRSESSGLAAIFSKDWPTHSRSAGNLQTSLIVGAMSKGLQAL